MKVLVLNAGSSSVKHVVIDPQSESCELEGKIERIGQGVTHEQAFSQILERCAGISIDAVGHRVVHGGNDFHQAAVITADVEAGIRSGGTIQVGAHGELAPVRESSQTRICCGSKVTLPAPRYWKHDTQRPVASSTVTW